MIELHTPHEAAQWLRSLVTGTLSADSRTLAPGDGFVAWPGAASDGRNFVESAIGRGALACLIEKTGAEQFSFQSERLATYLNLKSDTAAIAAEFFGFPSDVLKVVAVTGTNGKTSTAWWLAEALNLLPSSLTIPCGVIGTLGIGKPPEVQANGLTTPDPVLLQRSLHNFVDMGLRACAIEASSIGIEEKRLDSTRIEVAVFTNFTQDHLDYHPSMKAYWEAKRRLFSWPRLKSAVVNVDDAMGVELATALRDSSLDVWSVSQTHESRLFAKNIAALPQGTQFEVVEGRECHLISTGLIGSYNVSNLLGVLGAMRAMNVPLQQAVQACSQLAPVPGRMECVGGVHSPLVAIDYAHTPDALAKVLDALRPIAQGRNGKLLCLFGCGGDRDATKRPLMGAIAAKGADKVIVTSDNPRSERPEAIIAQILVGLPKVSEVQVEPDRAIAIAKAIAHADTDDVILLAGKGHETTQEISGTRVSFSDVSHAENALKLRSDRQGVAA